MRSGAGAVPTGGRGWGRSGPQRNPFGVLGRPGSILHQARSHPPATCAVGLVGIHRSARDLSPGGWDLGRHRAWGRRLFLYQRRPVVCSTRSLPLFAPGRQLALSQRRSDPAPGFLRLGQSPPCPQRSAATVAPSCRAPLPEPGRAQLDSALPSGSATFHPPRAVCFPTLA
jgi:hypothetical protein